MLPDCLKKENLKPPSKLHLEIKDAMKRYEEHFGSGLMTHAWLMPQEEWVTFINECIEKKKTEEEMLGIKYDIDPDVDY